MATINNMTDRVNQLIQGMDMASPTSVEHALQVVKGLDDLSSEEKLKLATSMTEVFFHAHHTGATQLPKLAARVEKQVAAFGPEMMPFLFNEIHEVDSESAAYFGKTFSRSGKDALDYILPKLVDYKERDHDLINLIQVLSYFKVPEASKCISPLLQLAKHQNHQVTAMALYTIGRLMQKLPANAFDASVKSQVFDAAFQYMSSTQELVRKLAVGCLGKMLRKGLLQPDLEAKFHHALLSITGRDEKHSWDRAFIVRREAEVFLPYFHKASPAMHLYKQSHRIVVKRLLCPNTYHFKVESPLIARKIEAGQFVIIRPNIYSERIPISVCGWDRDKGTLDLIISAVGKTTTQINAMQPGDAFQDVVGPLGGRSALPDRPGTCVVIGGGYGTGAVIPTARDLKAMGCKVTGIVGARNAGSLIMLNELQEVCDEVIITTNDGTQGIRGFVTDALQEVLRREKLIYILAVGPVPMMKAVSDMTRWFQIPTYVSLNAIMVDGTGMCGACRVTVGGETKFACFHGPDFDGHKVDFDNLMKRQKMFVRQEKLALASMPHEE